MIGTIPGTDVHWGLAVGGACRVLVWVLMNRTKFGFAARITGGNVRAARAQGLPVGKLVVIACALAGACAGLAGFFEVAAIQGRANASLAAGYGFTGILVAFLARQNPLAIVPVAIFLGGIDAAGGLVQRRMELPDATVQVLQGLMFVVLLVSETLYGRFPSSTRRPANDRRIEPVHRAAGDARRRDPRLDAVPLRQPRRVPDPRSPGASISASRARSCSGDGRLRRLL
jgi:ABC-type uncharacterized transport system permease subunit